MRSAGSRAALLATLALVACGTEAGSELEGSAASPLTLAPGWLVAPAGHGTWTDEGSPDVVFAWIDARVANVRYDKRVFVEVHAPYDDGTAIRTLLPTSYRGPDGDHDRWGTDAIELYPTGGPGGSSLAGPALYRFRVQHDIGAGETMVLTPWAPLFGDGAAAPPVDDVWAEALTSPVRTTDEGSLPEVHFAPFEDPGAALLARIAALTELARQEPEVRHTLHVAVYNVNDPELVAATIEAHRAGVEVRVLHDGRKHRPWYDWYFGDDQLLAAGVPLLGVRRQGTGAMHDKIVLIDGELVVTGSMNWEHGARFDNHENLLFTTERSVVAAYSRRFEALAGGPRLARSSADDASARVSVSFAPDEEPHRVAGDLLDAAESRIVVAMFTAKDVVYEQDGARTSLLTKLAEAVARGVEVTALVDYGVHEASEFFGQVTEDDPTDEWLEAQGVNVVRVDNAFGRYASMHHKFVVIDDEVAVTGAFNWYYDAAFSNDEDQIVWRDRRVAELYLGEAIDMLRRYDPAFDASAWPSVELVLEVQHDGTSWGEQLAITGSLPSLGAWSPADAIQLDGAEFPTWRGRVTLPLGTRFEAKAVVLGHGGVRWEAGANRSLRALPGVSSWRFGAAGTNHR